MLGLPFAMLQGPLSRFGDTAANSLVIAAFSSLDPTASVPLIVKTAGGSLAAGLWRIVLMPIDTVKTTLQVSGDKGPELIRDRISKYGLQILYSGSVAASAATFVGHFPWFLTYNSLSTALPTSLADSASDYSQIDHYSIFYILATHPQVYGLLRSAFIGLCASSASDICSNSLR